MGPDGPYHLPFSNPSLVEMLIRSFAPDVARQLDFATLRRENSKQYDLSGARREGGARSGERRSRRTRTTQASPRHVASRSLDDPMCGMQPDIEGW